MNTKWNIFKKGIRQYRAFKKFSRLSDLEKNNSLLPEQFVADILALGPAFIKLGQILSTRPDLLPAQYITALEKLQENVPPFEFSEVKKIVEIELSGSLDKLFTSFGETQAASASLSQVHFARLHSGEDVAVKVRRPGLVNQMNADLNTLSQLISFARFFKRNLFRNLNLDKVFQEFRRYTLQELDFSLEGKTYDRFRQNFKGSHKVFFPKIYWDYSTPSLLTMERVSGLRLNQVESSMTVEARKELSENVIEVLINMFVRDGFFHADLHPGNIFFNTDSSMTMIDVGMFGELTREQRERFILYWLAIVLKEKQRAFYHLLKLTNKTAKANEKGFYSQYIKLLDDFYDDSIQEKSLTQTYLEILVTGAKYGFVFPSEMLLQAKALTTAEHIGYVLVPGFNFAETAKPIVAKVFFERFSSDNIISRYSNSYPEWFLLGETARTTFLDNGDSDKYLWNTVGEEIAKKWDSFHDGDYKELRHGEYAVEIDKDIESVFNFVTRFAQYPLWHPIYTDDSHVIHVSGKYVFITPEVVGSVFRLDEIVDGYHLLSNGIITGFKRNKLLKWKAPFSMLPLVELGTCLSFEQLKTGKTRLSEYFFFSESPLQQIFVNRKWFTVEALTNHIREELTGVKNILEAGSYSTMDAEYLWEGLKSPVRFLDKKAYKIEHVNGGPMPSILNKTEYV